MKKVLLLGAALPLFLLTACGEGWDQRSYDNTPYGDRTAGSGVEYVRANMMPERGPVLKAAEPELQSVAVEDKREDVDPLLNSGEKIFSNAVKK